MGSNKAHLRFAVLSAILVAAMAAGFLLLALGGESQRRHEQAAASAAAGIAAAPLLAIFDDVPDGAPASTSVRQRADAIAWALSAGEFAGIRVTAPDSRVLYTSGVDLGPERGGGGDGVSHARTTLADGTALFVTRSASDGLAVEVAQDAVALDSRIASSQARVVIVTVVIALLAFVLLQFGFRWSVAGYKRAQGHLEYLYDTGQELRSSLDLHDVLSRLSGDATKLVGGQYGLVALFDEETSDVLVRATYDGLGGDVALVQKPIDDWFVRRCVATNTTIVDNQSAAAFRAFFGSDIEGEGGSILCVPMAINDRVVGCIAILRMNTRAGYTPEELRLVEHLAAQAVTAVEQAVLFAKVRADAKQLESSYDSTLKALMAALDAKDEVTEGHSERVGKLTLELARMMGIPDQKMVHIERGALLHDVGKIGVPDGILKKPHALSDHEWEAMRKHPLLAGLMVSKVGFLEPALPILLYHHEKYDGTGYPFGLAGGNIPLEARVFSVIDAYDAMTSDRPYRPAMAHHDAMDEVRLNSGTQFDPDVVAAFEELMASRRDLREPYSGRRVLGMHDLEDAQDHPDSDVA